MGKTPVGGLFEQSPEGVEVLDEARKGELDHAGYVDFVTTGGPATGAFRCSACGYGVTVQSTLPRCPMCNGTIWERNALYDRY
jgi:rubrerythrin